jgi:hypothetical protein
MGQTVRYEAFQQCQAVPIFPIGIAFLIRPYRVGWLYPSLSRANRFNRSLLLRQVDCFTDFHHVQIGFYVALFHAGTNMAATSPFSRLSVPPKWPVESLSASSLG